MSLVEKFLKSAAEKVTGTSVAKDAPGSSDKKGSNKKASNKKESNKKPSKPIVRSKKYNVRSNKKYKKHNDKNLRA